MTAERERLLAEKLGKRLKRKLWIGAIGGFFGAAVTIVFLAWVVNEIKHI